MMHKSIFIFLNVLFGAYSVTAQVEQESKKTTVNPPSPVIDSLLHLLSSATDTNRVILLNKLSYQFLIRSSYKEALSFGKEAFDLSEKLNYKKGKAKSLINQGNVFSMKSQFDEAKEYFLNAHFLAKEIGNNLILSHSINNLGEVYRKLGDYPTALAYYMEGLKLDEKAKDKEGQAGTLNNIGLLHEQMKNNILAIEFYERSLAMSREIKNQYYISTNLLNLGTLYFQDHNIEKSLVSLEESLKIKKEINDLSGLSGCYMGMGSIYFEKNIYDLALSYYLQALNIGKTIDSKLIVGSCLNNIGNIYSKLNQHQKALGYHQDFLSISLETKARPDRREAYENISLDYENLKDYENALKFQRLNSQLRDSIFSLENSLLIADLDSKYKSEKKEHEIESLKQEQQLQKRINQNQKIIFGSVVTIVLLAGALFYYRNQVNKQKNIRLSEKIDAQNRELSTIAMLVTKKNSTLSQLKEKLEKISGENISSVIKDIGNEIAFDEEWDTFKYHFEKVHPEFFTKIKQVVPGLSVTELRLCAYFKSNLSTKEISQLTNTTVRGVQQGKYRINQKFKEAGINLSDYL